MPARFLPENIDPTLCTHIIYAFAKINDAMQLASFEWNDESTQWHSGMYQKVINLKTQNPNLKVLLAVGGWNHGGLPFSNMVRNETSRKAFVSGAVKFLVEQGFDGLGRNNSLKILKLIENKR